MDREFQLAYRQLNTKQKLAVDTIDGPVLVLAGPGTGKTQLLSSRAANIVHLGAASAANILCLTYTDVGASELRQRLGRIMGPAGSDVTVHTFHSFGTWLIRQYPEQFSTIRSLRPLDVLGRYHILEVLLEALPFRHAFARRGDHDELARLRDVADGIQAFKRAGYEPSELRAILDQNQKEYAALEPLLAEIFVTKLSAKRLDAIAATVNQALQAAPAHSYSAILLDGLSAAVAASQQLGKTAALGDWRTKYTTLQDGQRILKSSARQQEVRDLVDVYEKYQERLLAEGRFDYEDMVLQAAEVLEQQADLRLDVAERFQYLMVDEYQDTNGAQNRLLDAILTANPLDSPNVLVVGDDDQAIMRFQGAEVSGMVHFIETYEPVVIPLEDNYRSGQPILDAASQIIGQTAERLETALLELGLNKTLTAHTTRPTEIAHWSYRSPSAEYAAVAQHVAQLIKQGVAPSEIAVISRKHPELKDFVPFMIGQGIAISYDRRENILDDGYIRQLLELARFVQVLSQQPQQAQSLLPTVLAADYWNMGPYAVYDIAIAAKQAKQSWLNTMRGSDNQQWRDIAEWLVAASAVALTHNFTQMLDVLIGRDQLKKTALLTSPFANYLTSEPPQTPQLYVSLLSHLICLRSAVLSARPTAHGLQDFLEVVDDYRHSQTLLIDDNPLLRGGTDNVQLMSAHSAKGREFEHVIMLSAVDPLWGPKARGGRTSRIPLPENLPLYPAGDTDSDKIRLFYVALTRAKSHLLLTSYEQTETGKPAVPLSYLQLGDQTDWSIAIPQPDPAVSTVQLLETSWRPTVTDQRSLREVLQPALKDFRLSPSALKTFLDLRYSGPQACIERSVLRFPSAYNAHSALGEATHKTLEAAHAAAQANEPIITITQLLEVFDRRLDESGLNEQELHGARQHGHDFLPLFVQQFDFSQLSASETYVTATIGERAIPVGGQIDALIQTNNQLQVLDYKTGQPPLPNWETTGLSDSKKTSYYFYRQQLLFYKLLLDNSAAYGDHAQVTVAELVFAEPTSDGSFIRLRIDVFSDEELARTQALITAVYDCLQRGQVPDTSHYSLDLKGIKAFEDDLLSGTV